jgi:hypothetical protein
MLQRRHLPGKCRYVSVDEDERKIMDCIAATV